MATELIMGRWPLSIESVRVLKKGTALDEK